MMLNKLRMLYEKKCINCEYFHWYDDGHYNGIFCYDTECKLHKMRMCFDENTNVCEDFQYEKVPGLNRKMLNEAKEYYRGVYENEQTTILS